MIVDLLTAALAAASFTVAGQDTAAQTPPPPQDEGIVVKGKKDPRDKRVCKRANATGSILAKATCRTAGEWEIERQRALAAVDQIRQAKEMDAQARGENYRRQN